VTACVADRINQETPAIAVDLSYVVESPLPRETSRPAQFDRHPGVAETSGALYLFPPLVDLVEASSQISVPLCGVVQLRKGTPP